VKRFISFVELSTKLASMTPFFIGVAYCLQLAKSINLPDTALLGISVLFFDMPVTMINNYLDKRRAKEEPHYSKPASLAMILSMVAASLVLGLYLSSKYGLCFLAGGALCYFVGIFYSATPISISRTPYGEIVSGLVQGFTIIFLVALINLPKGYLAEASLSWESLSLNVNIWNMARLILVTLPPVFCIANIMLANNACDVARDSAIDRYTLPYYIGKDASILLFKLVYLAAYLSIAASAVARVLHPISLLALLPIPLVWRNVKAFSMEQVKAKTFIVSIKNFALILIPYALTIFLGALF
jgi:1,4-dihydroxy-2-naphthoate octaprenyltransferase